MVSSVIWISVAIAVVLLIALAVGLLLARRRRISIAEKPGQQVEAPAPPRRYQAGGSISFSAGGGGPPAPPQVPPPSQVLPPSQASAPAPPKPPAQAPGPVRPQAFAPAPPKPPPPAVPPPADLALPASVAPPAPTKPVPPEPVPTKPAPVEQAPAKPAPAEPAPAEPVAAEPAGALVEPIDAPAGRLVRLRGRLSRSRSAFGQSLLGLLGAGDLDEDSWTDVEDTLLLADLGAATTAEIVERLRTELAQRGVRTAEQARAALRDVLIEALRPELDRSVRALPHDGADGASVPGVVLIAGVNGTGKTTTTGKLARVLVADGRRVLLGAADTFRAAAVDQLVTWGERAGAEVVRGAEGADPASVAFDAVKRGSADGVDTVLIDTAGRLHTKTGLMDELGKVKRVVSKQTEVDEVLLVLDATTGQNGMTQAKVFREVVDVTGIVLTKLDGTAKGGIVFHVQRELGVPVKLVGLGEGVDDLAPFEPVAFVDALLD
ncbi:MAG: signal recognition particle-docking protein FtsY [Pseudonocardiales bacterium]|nr:signal recognition particle-docking protein FtsY [Pseudonocardiales bacterium]